jgi:hypothetical protein
MICQHCREQDHVMCPSIMTLAQLVQDSTGGENIPFALIDGAKTLCDCNHRVEGRAALDELTRLEQEMEADATGT